MATTGDNRRREGLTLLYVDRDPRQAEMYRIRLQRRGFDVRCAFAADSAMGAIRQGRPDLVVMEAEMADEDGPVLCSRLRQAHPLLPVIVHTAYPDCAQALTGCEACACVTKSQDLGPLLEAIDQAVERPPVEARR
jgi:DNA-binding NtrC family response regulator